MKILKSIFGPSINQAWQKIALDIGAQNHKPSLFKQSKITYQHQNWEITLDTHTLSRLAHLNTASINNPNFTYKK